jgi:hypothetical protein
MPPNRNSTIGSVSVMMITVTTRGVIMGWGLRSVTTMGFSGTTGQAWDSPDSRRKRTKNRASQAWGKNQQPKNSAKK